MSIIGNEALAGASGQAGYFIDRSLRFRSSAGAYLSRTPSVNGNRQTFTFSCWIKRGSDIGSGARRIFESHIGGSDDFIRWNNDNIMMYFTSGAMNVQTTAVYRDPSAWYHIVWRVDTTQATASDRNRLYVNGVQVTTFSTATYPSQNYSTGSLQVAGKQHNIGSYGGSTEAIDGYLTEVNFIDGQSLDASYFGETDTDTGVWKPIEYIGSYGTNGFYLNFKNPATTVTLCADQSGNGNNWGANNISLSAGSTYDSMQDVPTLTSASAGNFATLNPLTRPVGVGGAFTLSDGNLKVAMSYIGADSSIAMSSGKWYWEVQPTANTAAYNPRIGIVPSNHGTYTGTSVGDGSGTYGYASTGQKGSSGSYSAYGASYTDSDVIGVAFDSDAGSITFYKNGVSQGVAFTGISGEFYASTGSGGNGGGLVLQYNFGQRPFAYTPPTGYKALNTYNLPTPTIADGSDYFDTALWTGNGSDPQTISGLNFQPDFVWAKSRSNATSHVATDAVRGDTKTLYPDTTNVEATTAYINFNSDGFDVKSALNFSPRTYVGWSWKANGSGVSNTAGSITSTVSANTTSGFSIVSYHGNSTSGATIGHGLGVAPSMFVVKSRDQTRGWNVYHTSLGNTKYIQLQSTAAPVTNSAWWNNTSPSSSVITLGNDNDVNGSTQDYICYAFAPISGYSAFGSYTGNGSTDGPFVYTGFRPAFVMMKRTDTAGGSWPMIDDKRNGFNIQNYDLYANLTQVEATSVVADLTSNGFKLRGTSSEWNGSSNTYIYMAFAENPFKYSLAR